MVLDQEVAGPLSVAAVVVPRVLVVDALKFSPRGGAVQISIGVEGDSAVVAVSTCTPVERPQLADP